MNEAAKTADEMKARRGEEIHRIVDLGVARENARLQELELCATCQLAGKLYCPPDHREEPRRVTVETSVDEEAAVASEKDEYLELLEASAESPDPALAAEQRIPDSRSQIPNSYKCPDCGSPDRNHTHGKAASRLPRLYRDRVEEIRRAFTGRTGETKGLGVDAHDVGYLFEVIDAFDQGRL